MVRYVSILGGTMTTEELLKKYNIQIAEALSELKTPGQRHKQIPNILTFGRLLSPLVIIPTALLGNSKGAAELAVLFGLTDLADGFIARKWNLSSPLGADLDALTDKVFVGTLLLTGSITNPYLLVNTGLEGIIASINLKQKILDNKPSSTIMGKIKTGAIFTLGGLGVVSGNDKILVPLAVTTALLQTMTIASYVKKYDRKDVDKSQTNNKLIEQLKEEREFWTKELENSQKEGDSKTMPTSEYEESRQKVKL